MHKKLRTPMAACPYYSHSLSLLPLFRRDQVFAMYQKTLQKYSHVVLCREKLDGSLRGLVLVGLEYKKTHTVLKVYRTCI